MGARRATRFDGFTMIEVMIAVAIVGVLAALAIAGVRRYLLHAKTAEPRNALGQMAKDAAVAYSRETMAGNVLGAQAGSGVGAALCTTASQAVPSAITTVKGKKFQSSPTNWDRDQATANKGFACLRFSMSDPQYYMYNYVRTSAAIFTGVIYGSVTGTATQTKAVFISPNIAETSAEE